ncbi:hypothetical protein J1N35_045793 [Gossypium stocksii]|uniref:RNase H type-1 domain-containing protein n=1 Tax=Gossypium stocksii TaxID=47602 RepID=A0A9D3ZGS4_9ROSI|nr:hypothetical protein J1N35_045793 [Gossypium stocksii]
MIHLPLLVELSGVVENLSILKNYICLEGYDNLLIQFDNLETVKDIYESSLKGFNSALVRRIHRLLSRFGCWSILHISREDNQEADSLVKTVHERRHGLRLFEVLLFREGFKFM